MQYVNKSNDLQESFIKETLYSMGKRPFIRPLGQFVLKIGLGTLTRKRYSDPECGFRALSRRAMEVMEFKGKGFTVEAEMIRLAEKHGLKTIEVPVTEIYVEGGSTLNPGWHGFGNLGTIIAWVSEKRPLFFLGCRSGVHDYRVVLGANVLYNANMGRGVAVEGYVNSVVRDDDEDDFIPRPAAPEEVLNLFLYIKYNDLLFKTQIYADLRRRLFHQVIKCLTFIINSIEDSNNLLRLLNLIFKILIIHFRLRPIIKIILSCFYRRGGIKTMQGCLYVLLYKNSVCYNLRYHLLHSFL